MTLAEVNQKVRTGYRMPPPEGMPIAVGEIMTKNCYPVDPDDRFSMMQIRKLVEECMDGSGKNAKTKSILPKEAPTGEGTELNGRY